jgi:ABC-2 type transport system permease protein
MNTQSNVVPESSLRSQTLVASGIKPSQQLYWSVRREFWDSRWIYIAPVAVAGLYILGFLIGMMHWLDKIREGANGPQLLDLIEQPYNFAALLIMGSTFIIALFYCLDTLHSERRDRSILFWKSLPVSDLTTVLAKASIPLVILPLLTFAITVATHWIMLLLSSGILLARGLGVAILWNHLPLFDMWLGLLYHLVAIHGLWYAPIYGWLLMISAWATRVPVLWAALPPLAIGVAERIAFNTSHFAALVEHRIGGGIEGGKFMAANTTMHPLMQLEPVRFLTSPGLWTGFLLTALFLAAAVRLRHYRGPI